MPACAVLRFPQENCLIVWLGDNVMTFNEMRNLFAIHWAKGSYCGLPKPEPINFRYHRKDTSKIKIG